MHAGERASSAWGDYRSVAAEEWEQVARLEPVEPGRNRADEVPSVLTAWLAQRGVAPTDLSEDDVRVDLAYLGPDDGRCAVIISVRRAAVSGT